MSEQDYIFVGIFLLVMVSLLRKLMIQTFKISYYETKLEHRNVDIQKVKNIGLIGIFKI